MAVDEQVTHFLISGPLLRFRFIPGEHFLLCKSYSLHEVYPEHVTLERILMVLFLCIYLIFSTKLKTC